MKNIEKSIIINNINNLDKCQKIRKEFEVEFPLECSYENNLKEATGCNDLTIIIDEIKKLHSLEQVVIVSRFFKNMTLVQCGEIFLPGNDDIKRKVVRQIEVVAVEKLKINLK